MPVIQGSSAYSTKAELIPGIWRGFFAVQLLPVLSAGLGCNFGQGGKMAAFSVFFLSFPLPSLSSLLSLMLQPCLPAVCLPLCYGLQCRACGCLSSADLGRLLPLWLLLAVSPVPRLWRWRSSLCPCFSPSSLCYGSALRGLPSLCPCLASAVCPPAGRGCLSVSLSGRHDLHRLRPLSSVLPPLAAGWPYVQANSVWSICTKTPLQIWLLFKVKAGKF